MRVRLYGSAIASCFGFLRKIRRPATCDFCNTICQEAALATGHSITFIVSSMTDFGVFARAPMLNCHAYGTNNVYVGCPRALQAIPACSDQAVALRRRRLRDPMVARDDPIEFARSHLWHCGRLRRAPGPR